MPRGSGGGTDCTAEEWTAAAAAAAAAVAAAVATAALAVAGCKRKAG